MKNIVPIILVVAAIAGITIYSQKNKDSDKMMKNDVMEKHGESMEKMEKSDAMMADDKMAMEKEAMMKDDKMMKNDLMEKHGESMEKMEKSDAMMADDKMAMEKEAMMKKSGSFVDYSDVSIADLDGKIVLDFSATWCPSCRTFKKDVEASLSDIPADLTIVLVDYDTNKDLRKKYSVRSQHTFVQIDNKGNKINLWSGGSTLESLLPHIK